MTDGVTITEDSGVNYFVSCIPGKTSDGYHTFDELYEHRCLLFIAFCRLYDVQNVWRSRKHADGSEWDGWFIAGANIHGKAISYHIPARMWDLMNGVPILDNAPEWDGHTSQDVIDRLTAWLSCKG